MFTYNFFIQQNFLTVFGDQPYALLVYDIQVNFTVFRKIQNNFRTVHTVFPRFATDPVTPGIFQVFQNGYPGFSSLLFLQVRSGFHNRFPFQSG